MDQIVANLRGPVSVAVGASRHLLWYLGYQMRRSGAR
jgi:hypothetical protein